MRWINVYRTNPEPAGVPAAVKALSRFGSSRPRAIGRGSSASWQALSPPTRRRPPADQQMLPLPAGDQWVVVRAIAIRDIRTGATCCAASPPRPARQVISTSTDRDAAAPLSVREGASISTWGLGQEQGHGRSCPRPCARASPELLDTTGATISPRPCPGRSPASSRCCLVAGGGQRRQAPLGSMAKYTLASNDRAIRSCWSRSRRRASAPRKIPRRS